MKEIVRDMSISLFESESEVPDNFTGRKKYIYLDKRVGYDYFVNGECHRIDGPAQIIPRNRGVADYFDYYFILYGKVYDSKEEWFEVLTEDEKLQAMFNADEWNK